MVSVILPTYNRAAFIAESVQSVLQQTYSDLELIIVDDGSDDETESIIKSIADKRIYYYKLPHTGHIGKVKNFALQKAKREYIAYMDSDDIWIKNKLEKQLPLFKENPSIGYSITDMAIFKDKNILKPYCYSFQNIIEYKNVFNLIKKNAFVIFTPTIVAKRKCLDYIGPFDEMMPTGVYHYSVRLAHYFDAGIIYEPLLLRRLHNSNTNELMQYDEYIKTFEYLYHNKMVEKKYLHKTKAFTYYKVGEIYKNKGNIKQARKNYLKSLIYKPFSPRRLFSFLNTWFNL